MGRRRDRDAQRRESAFAAGRNGDFATQYQKSYRVLWTVAAGVASPADADEILQEAAVQALRRQDQYQPRTNFTAWMARIVRYVALNHRRSRRRHTTTPLQNVENHEPGCPQQQNDSPVTSRGQLMPEQQAFDDDLVRALQSLAEMPRACLLLRIVHEMSYAEIAHILDIPEGTAMSYVHRSRQQLRKRLEPHGNGHPNPGDRAAK